MPSEHLHYTGYDPARDQAALIRMLVMAFAGPADGTVAWIEGAGAANLRVVRLHDQTVGCLLRIPMAQYFGGVAVPMVGIAGVAVAPEARGMGIARFMMQRAMQECAADGTALSTLYASTQSLYRQVGYEQAGLACRITLPVVHIPATPREGLVHALTPADQPAIEDCARAFASTSNGPPARGPYLWNRVREFRKETYTPFGIRAANGAIDGYLYMRQERKPETGRQDLHLTDIAFRTPQAGHLLLGFVKDFASMADDLHFAGGPWHPLLMLLDQQRFHVAVKEYWMLRITDVAAALTQRAYPRTIRTSACIEIEDETVPQNAGPWTITIDAGKATVTRTGTPVAKLHIRALAPFYTGLTSAPDLARCGLASGDIDALSNLSTALRGQTPWMPDFF